MRKASKSHDTIQKQVEPVTPEKIGPRHPDQHGGDLLPEDVPIEDESNNPLDDVISLITTLDLIQMMMMMTMKRNRKARCTGPTKRGSWNGSPCRGNGTVSCMLPIWYS